MKPSGFTTKHIVALAVAVLVAVGLYFVSSSSPASDKQTGSSESKGLGSLAGVLKGDIAGDPGVPYEPIDGTQDAANLQYYLLEKPVRLFDSRPGFKACDTPGEQIKGGSTRTLSGWVSCADFSIPSTARALVGNLTVVDPAAAGYATLYPSGHSAPLVSNLNYTPETNALAAHFTTRLANDGTFKLYSVATAHYVMDLEGYYAPPALGGLYYHPLPKPVRWVDTRGGGCKTVNPLSTQIGPGHVRIPATGTCSGVTVPSDAKVLVGNITMVAPQSSDPSGWGWVAVSPLLHTVPETSTINFKSGDVIANRFNVRLASGDNGESLFAVTSPQTSGNFIIDVIGYYNDKATDANGQGLTYVPLNAPTRLLDTRPGELACDAPGTPLVAGLSRLQNAFVNCGDLQVPNYAKALEGTAVVVNARGGPGYVAMFPADTRLPSTSDINYVKNQTIANGLGNIRLSTTGQFRIWSKYATDFVVDVAGYFVPYTVPVPVTPMANLVYYPLDKPVRLFDSRPGMTACVTPGQQIGAGQSKVINGRTTCEEQSIPPDAQALVGNLTVVAPAAAGWTTLYPSGHNPPTASNVNYAADQVIAGHFTTRLANDGTFRLYSSAKTHAIVDVGGYYAPNNGSGAGLYYHPLPKPVRLTDTRDSRDTPYVFSIGFRLGGNHDIPETAKAAIGNLTIVAPNGVADGWATVYTLGGESFELLNKYSSINYASGQVIANRFNIRLGGPDGGEFGIVSTQKVAFIVDITGYYSDQPADENGPGLMYTPLTAPVRLYDTRPGSVSCQVQVPIPLVANQYTRIQTGNCGDFTPPASIEALAGMITVIPSAPDGWLTVFPASVQTHPGTSDVNWGPANQAIANSLDTGLSDGSFQVVSSTNANLIVDVTGSFTPVAVEAQ